MKNIRFDSEFTKQLYTEVSALADMNKLKKDYITLPYMWKLWKKVYRSNFGSTRHVFMPGELFEDKGEEQGGQV
ncbi:MAG: hypothetical protein K6G03_12550 [Lachnospiraceae bacterium]|nr:hypothetical protein [Lachnospiraceae bacterium]